MTSDALCKIDARRADSLAEILQHAPASLAQELPDLGVLKASGIFGVAASGATGGAASGALEVAASGAVDTGDNLLCEDGWSIIRTMCTAHCGELRELRGSWTLVHGPCPSETHLYDSRLKCSQRDSAPGQINAFFGKAGFGLCSADTALASGSEDRDAYHLRRDAVLVGLADLFLAFGDEHSAKELYSFYMSLRVFLRRARKRL